MLQYMGLRRVRHDWVTELNWKYNTLKSTVVQYNSWHTEAGIESLGKKSYDWRRERRWVIVKLKEGQQQETEGKLHFHSRVTLMAQVLVPCWNQMHVCTFESLQLDGWHVADLLYCLSAQHSFGKLKDLYAEMCWPSQNGGWFQHLRNVHFISF